MNFILGIGMITPFVIAILEIVFIAYSDAVKFVICSGVIVVALIICGGNYLALSMSPATAEDKLEAYSEYVADSIDENTILLKGGNVSSEVMTDRLLAKYYLIPQKENSVQLISKSYNVSKDFKEV